MHALIDTILDYFEMTSNKIYVNQWQSAYEYKLKEKWDMSSYRAFRR